jgi:hypothetical protein
VKLDTEHRDSPQTGAALFSLFLVHFVTYITIGDIGKTWIVFSAKGLAMSHLYWEMMSWVGRLGPREWLAVGAVAIGIGLLCMRGFGSRSNY